jgi:hypothetical protein
LGAAVISSTVKLARESLPIIGPALEAAVNIGGVMRLGP